MNFVTLNKMIKACRRCEGLNIPKKTMSAPGYGSRHAELFVIGQSLHSYNANTPDRQIPFVGPIESSDSGILLYEILEEAGYSFDNNNVFITNVVHCHPPENRSSKSCEKTNCSEYLEDELGLVKPKKVLLLGRDARDFFGLPKIGTTLRISKRWHNMLMTFIVAHHPSYVCRYHPEIKGHYEKELITLLKGKT